MQFGLGKRTRTWRTAEEECRELVVTPLELGSQPPGCEVPPRLPPPQNTLANSSASQALTWLDGPEGLGVRQWPRAMRLAPSRAGQRLPL